MPAAKETKTFHELAVSGLARYGPRILYYLKARWPHPADWDDLMQEVRLRLMRMDPNTIVRNPLAYLYTVASHVLSDWRARDASWRQHVVVDSEAVEEWAQDSANAQPDEMAELLNRERQVQEALSKLPPREGEALKLDYDGVPREQIAERMGLDVDSVNKYIIRARARMRLFRWDI